MKQLKLFAIVAVTAATFLGGVAMAQDTSGLVGKTYVSAAANATDLRSHITANDIYGGTVGVNVAAIPYVDVGGSVQVQRLQDNKLDLNDFNTTVNATTYKHFGVFTPYIRGTTGFVFERQNAKHFQAFTYSVAGGAELALFKNLSVGADYTVGQLQKATIGGTERSYRGYATFWLNDHVGVTAGYTYNQAKSSADYAVGTVVKF